jgi:hypothetical protein
VGSDALRIQIVGSLPDHIPGTGQDAPASDDALPRAGRALGWALAVGDARAILGSDSPRTIDPYVVEGYAEYCRENPLRQRHIEIRFPDRGPQRHIPAYPNTPENLHLLPIEDYADPSNPHRWIVAHFSALRTADVLLVIGGGTSTRLLGSYATSSRIPVVALRDFGGSSSDVFLLARHTYQEAVPALGSEPTRETGMQVVDFIHRLLRTTSKEIHSYFLSYSWADCASADITEVLLRRFGRMVFRDEDQVKVGHRLPDQLESSTQESDTFVALWSHGYQSSNWCPAELEFALDSKARIGRPRRIAILEIDENPASIRATNLLRMSGQSREAIHLGVRRLIEQE